MISMNSMRRFIYGQPLSTEKVDESRLRKLLALPIFCSDAISSVAYGPQQILLALCMGGLWMPSMDTTYSWHAALISALIILVLILVGLSYWQTIFAYPGGGGSYIVTKDNLGAFPGLVAASALLIDYVLCVSVSVASGMQNLRDVPLLAPLQISRNMVAYEVMGIVGLSWLNLRGLRTPGVLFAIPVYVFIAMSLVMIGCGLVGPFLGWPLHPEFVNQTVPPDISQIGIVGSLSVVILLRAFATGCSALTGVECVSNGIPAFRAPSQRNAAITLGWMVLILGAILTGITTLAIKFHVVYWEHGGMSAPAVIDQISGAVFGKSGATSILYNVMQLSTAAILFVAAQTAFADFPRVTSILSRDGYMPRQLSNLGDRLAFDNGIIILAVMSAIFIFAQKGSVDLLIPFFTIGVFVAFTLSQSGMIFHWFKTKGSGWRTKALFNGFGAAATLVVSIDIIAEKFVDGAWFVILMIFVLLFVFIKIKNHYMRLSASLRLEGKAGRIQKKPNDVIVLVQGVHQGTVNALNYAASISSSFTGVYVEIEPERTQSITQQWNEYYPNIPLVVLPSPYRSLIEPIMHFLDDWNASRPSSLTTVVIGEFVSDKWWHALLHGNTGLILKLALLRRKDVVVSNVRYWL